MEKEILQHVINRCSVEILNYKQDYVGIRYSKANGYYFLNGVLHITYDGGGTGKSLKEIKFINRPLSDLTKEIEHNGKTFVPAEYFWSIDLYDQQAFELYGTIPEYWKACMALDIRDFDFGVVERLLEWHFDIHGLIEKGLAIDINTLK